MTTEILKGEKGNFNLQDYEYTYNNFDWEEAEKAFSWYETGKVNMAYECIDRHVDNGKGQKIALNYKDSAQEASFTFEDLKLASNKVANLLKTEANVEKGDRVFVYMPRMPELYFSFNRYC